MQIYVTDTSNNEVFWGDAEEFLYGLDDNEELEFVLSNLDREKIGTVSRFLDYDNDIEYIITKERTDIYEED